MSKTNYNVEVHDVREVEYNVYENPINGAQFPQLTVASFNSKGKGKLITYDGEDAEFIYDILVGKIDVVKQSEHDDLYRQYVEACSQIDQREKRIRELEEKLIYEKKAHSELLTIHNEDEVRLANEVVNLRRQVRDLEKQLSIRRPLKFRF